MNLDENMTVRPSSTRRWIAAERLDQPLAQPLEPREPFEPLPPVDVSRTPAVGVRREEMRLEHLEKILREGAISRDEEERDRPLGLAGVRPLGNG